MSMLIVRLAVYKNINRFTLNKMEISNKDRILLVISSIPLGSTLAYGKVAEAAGMHGAARFVGNTLRNLPTESSIPWHRVVNAQNKISFPLGSPRYLRQKERLESEGWNIMGNKLKKTT